MIGARLSFLIGPDHVWNSISWLARLTDLYFPMYDILSQNTRVRPVTCHKTLSDSELFPRREEFPASLLLSVCYNYLIPTKCYFSLMPSNQTKLLSKIWFSEINFWPGISRTKSELVSMKIRSQINILTFSRDWLGDSSLTPSQYQNSDIVRRR